jgi:hypothetical protein
MMSAAQTSPAQMLPMQTVLWHELPVHELVPQFESWQAETMQ